MLRRDDVGIRGETFYERNIRALVETEENIGRMVIIDLGSGDFEVDDLGLGAARILQSRHSNPVLYGKRIGYDVAEAL